MICPSCGRTLEVGEICPCQALNVARRDAELANEAENIKENNRISHEKKSKEKSEKVQAAAEKTDAAIDSAMNFGKRMVECFKNIDKIDELYISKAGLSDVVIVAAIHILLNILLVYLALCNSPLGLAFIAISVFSSRVKSALTIGAITIGILPMCAKFGIMKFKAGEKYMKEVTSEYIYTIPATLIAIIVSLISPGLGLAFIMPIVVFGSLWTAARLEKNGSTKEVSIIITTGIMFILSVLVIIICNLIA